MSGGGGNLFGTILNVVSLAVPVLRPVAIGFNMINSIANENPLGVATSAFGAYNAFGDAGISAVDAASGMGVGDLDASGWSGSLDPLGDAAANIDPSWVGTPFEGAADSSFLGSEGLQNAVNVDTNAWSRMVGDTVSGFDQALGAPLSQEGLGMLSDPMLSMGGAPAGGIPTSIDLGTPSSTFEAGTSENVFNPSTDGSGVAGDEANKISLEGIADTRFSGGDPFATQADVNKGFNSVTGYGLDNSYGKGSTGLPIGTENSMNNVFKKLTTPIGGGGAAQPMSPLMMGVKGFGALDSLFQGRKAQDIMERQFNAANNWTDPNRARGDEANRLWMQNYNDPRAGYNEFMTGAGREFTDQARAQAAKSGRRGAYLNSGKMQSDLASLFMKNQLQRGNALSQGFAGGANNYAATAAAAPGYAAMVRNQNAPIFDFLGEVSKNRSLVDLFGGNE